MLFQKLLILFNLIPFTKYQTMQDQETKADAVFELLKNNHPHQ